MFPSPCRVVVDCDEISWISIRDLLRFPSPCGVVVDCDRLLCEIVKVLGAIRDLLRFPSPCGVVVDCDTEDGTRVSLLKKVSTGDNPLGSLLYKGQSIKAPLKIEAFMRFERHQFQRPIGP